MQVLPMQVDPLPLQAVAMQPNPIQVGTLQPNSIQPSNLQLGVTGIVHGGPTSPMQVGTLQPTAMQPRPLVVPMPPPAIPVPPLPMTVLPAPLPTSAPMPVPGMPSPLPVPMPVPVQIPAGLAEEARRQTQQSQIWAQLSQMGYKKADFRLPPNAADIKAYTPASAAEDSDKLAAEICESAADIEDSGGQTKKLNDELKNWRPQLPPRRASGKAAEAAPVVSTHFARLAMYSQYVNALQFQYAAAGYEVPGADGGTEANARGEGSGSRGEPGGYGSGGPFHGHDPGRVFTGVVTKWMDEEGFGFISCMESRRIYRKDVFLHKAQIGQEADLYKQRTKVDISRGDMIRFTVEIQRGQPRAKDVTIVGHSDRILAPDNFGGKGGDSVGLPAASSDDSRPEKKSADDVRPEKRRRQDDDHGSRRDEHSSGGSRREDRREDRRSDDQASRREDRRDDHSSRERRHDRDDSRRDDHRRD